MSYKNLKLIQLSILINYNKIFIQLNDGNSSILINAVRGISDTKNSINGLNLAHNQVKISFHGFFIDKRYLFCNINLLYYVENFYFITLSLSIILPNNKL